MTWARGRTHQRATRALIALFALPMAAAAACSHSAAPESTDSTPPPATSCAREHCTTPGTVRWSVPLGIAMGADVGAPAYFVPPEAHARPEFAAVGSVIVVGWDHTLVGVDARTGERLWRTTTVVAPAMFITAIHPVGSLAAATAVPRDSKVTGTENLLDPKTGRVLARLPALMYEGAVWTDGRSVVSIEPHALVRVVIATGRTMWSIPRPAKDRATQGTEFMTALVAGNRVAFDSGAGGARLVRLGDGGAVVGADPIRGRLFLARGNYLLTTSPAGGYDAAAGRTRWVGPVNSDARAIDYVNQTIYYRDDHRLLQSPIAGGAHGPAGAGTVLPRSLWSDDIVAVRHGVAVYLIDSGGELPTSSYYVGGDARTGTPRWSTYAVANLFTAPSLYWQDAGGMSGVADFLGGFTCPTVTPRAGPSRRVPRYRCADVQLTLMNI